MKSKLTRIEYTTGGKPQVAYIDRAEITKTLKGISDYTTSSGVSGCRVKTTTGDINFYDGWTADEMNDFLFKGITPDRQKKA